MKEFEGHRDAIHVPYVVMKNTLAHCIVPGCKISFRGQGPDGLSFVPWDLRSDDWHAIVDPFLVEPVGAGETFRAYICKECFSSLRHEFTIDTNYDGGTDTCHSVCDVR